MEISKKTEDGKTVIIAKGRVDTTTAPEFEAGLAFDGAENVTLDISGIPYMSSAGLRCLLSAQKKVLAGGGSLKITGVQDAVREVLDITGFSSILTIS